MTATDLVQKFVRLESEVAAVKGDFTLFALFLREDVPDRWDLIVAAPWVGGDKEESVNFLIDQIKQRLGEQELTNLSRIVLADPDDVSVANFNRAIRVEHGPPIEVVDSNFFGMPIKHAYIITSKRPQAPVER